MACNVICRLASYKVDGACWVFSWEAGTLHDSFVLVASLRLPWVVAALLCADMINTLCTVTG